MNKMCNLVTNELFDFSSVKIDYSADERKELADSFEEVRENWLEDMYGPASTLKNEAWIERIHKEGKWIFNAAELRARLFKEAKIEAKHFV